MTLDYELTDPNQPVTIELPQDCPPGMVDAPRLPDASAITEMPGVLIYQTATGLKEAAAFYEKEIPELGWEVVGEPSILDTMAMLGFTREAQTLTVILMAKDDVTTVHVVLSRSQE